MSANPRAKTTTHIRTKTSACEHDERRSDLALEHFCSDLLVMCTISSLGRHAVVFGRIHVVGCRPSTLSHAHFSQSCRVARCLSTFHLHTHMRAAQDGSQELCCLLAHSNIISSQSMFHRTLLGVPDTFSSFCSWAPHTAPTSRPLTALCATSLEGRQSGHLAEQLLTHWEPTRRGIRAARRKRHELAWSPRHWLWNDSGFPGPDPAARAQSSRPSMTRTRPLWTTR